MANNWGRRGAAAIVLCLSLIPHWEGVDLTVKPDRLAGGLPTGCVGQTTYDDPDLTVGQTFTYSECMERFRKDLPKYAAPIARCVKVPLTAHQWASLIDAAYNAGPGAVCKSPMVKAFNAGENGCDKFAGWHVGTRTIPYVRGLANRRSLDRRWSETAFCKMKDAA